jgi:predicted MFS family arabinose efflux permease
MTLAVGMIVANVYYIQPLLADIARTFALTSTGAGAVAMVLQLGTTCAMFFFVPLGDIRERRALISTLIGVLAVALAALALARNTVWLCLAAAAVGASGSVVHLIIPFAAHLAPPKERGRVVGHVIGGLLLGILLARTLSGWLGSIAGWRTVYWFACGLMAILAVLTRFCLPESRPTVRLHWIDLVRSILRLVRDEPQLREASVLGALFFLAFSAFWTTLVFLLETPPYHYGAAAAGLFGLVGAAGAAGAPLIGRIADKRGPRVTVGGALVLGLVSFLVLAAFGHNLTGLIVGVVLMDLAVQAGHVSNQTRIYNLHAEARNRLNSVYMTIYFIGGSAGSILGAWSWHLAQWNGVCACGIGAMALGLVVFRLKSPVAVPSLVG